jgi:hypothetical protein
VSAQPPSFDELVDKAARRSGLWEAPIVIDAVEGGPSATTRGLILRIQTQAEERAEGSAITSARASLLVEYERLGISPCGGFFPVTESGHIALEACDLRLDAFIDPDGQTVDGLIFLKATTIPVKFVRLPISPAPDREFAGTWAVSKGDRSVVFRIGYSLGGIHL